MLAKKQKKKIKEERTNEMKMTCRSQKSQLQFTLQLYLDNIVLNQLESVCIAYQCAKDRERGQDTRHLNPDDLIASQHKSELDDGACRSLLVAVGNFTYPRSSACTVQVVPKKRRKYLSEHELTVVDSIT